MENLCSNKQILLERIKYFYGLNENCFDFLRSYFESEDQDNTSVNLENLQDIFVEYILKEKIFEVYQPYFKYRRSFLKFLIRTIEEKNAEVNETILQEYIRLINEAPTASEQEKYFLIIFPKVIFKCSFGVFIIHSII
jgi:hypothetical protein